MEPPAPPRPAPAADATAAGTRGTPARTAAGSMGTAVQMAARSAEDDPLTRDPEISFWKAAPRRYTAFALETFADPFPLGLRFGAKTRATVSRRGDALRGLVLELRLPALRLAATGALVAAGATWVERPALAMCRRVTVRLGEQIVYDAERLWLDVRDKVLADAGLPLEALAGGAGLRADREQLVYLPLDGLLRAGAAGARGGGGLPFAALPNASALTVEVDVEPLAALVAGAAGGLADPGPLAAAVLSDVAWLGDEDERRGLLSAPTDLAFEMVADCEARSVVTDSSGVDRFVPTVSVDLREINHPVRWLAVVAYAEPLAGFFQYLPDPFEELVLDLGNCERFAPRRGDYFAGAHRYSFTPSASSSRGDGVHVYSFSLDAASADPNGQLNFAVVTNPRLRARLSAAVAGTRLVVKVFASYYAFATVSKGELQFKFT